jgi:hypothetical protein
MRSEKEPLLSHFHKINPEAVENCEVVHIWKKFIYSARRFRKPRNPPFWQARRRGRHIARLKQFSGHASLKSLEEYVELDELRQNHPLKDVL